MKYVDGAVALVEYHWSVTRNSTRHVMRLEHTAQTRVYMPEQSGMMRYCPRWNDWSALFWSVTFWIGCTNMEVYDYLCHGCGNIEYDLYVMEKEKDGIVCELCGRTMTRQGQENNDE